MTNFLSKRKPKPSTHHSHLWITFRFGSQPVDSPDLAEHRSEGQSEAGREQPRSCLAYSGIGTGGHESTI